MLGDLGTRNVGVAAIADMTALILSLLLFVDAVLLLSLLWRGCC